MSKKVKRIVSLLLTAGMLLSSCVGVFADTTEATTANAVATETATTETAATEAPAAEATATETPAAEVVATEAPVTGFAADSYYNEAAGLLTIMGIFEGYEDGTLKPESTITRAEMAAVILRIMDMDATSAYAGTFTDVDASHWAANIIQTAYNAEIINGMGDGTFAPDAPVTFEQAVKMIVCAIGYGNLATVYGGYPTGYITVAARKDIEITKNVKGQAGDEAARGNVIKMIYNTVNALYPTGSRVSSDGIEYTTDDDVTVGSKLHNVHSYEGIVLGTSKTSIDPTVALVSNQVKIDDYIYNGNGIDMNPYIAYKVKVYYSEENNDGDRKIMYVVPGSKNETLVIKDEDIEEITDIRSEYGRIEYTYSATSSKTKTAKLNAPTIVYNGKLLTAADIPAGYTMEEFITPDVGEITLNDFDNDGSYDVMFVNSYKTYVVTSISDTGMTGKYNTPAKLPLDADDDTKIVTIIKDGKKVSTKQVKKWDVATAQFSANVTGDQVINIEICNDTVEGKITDVDVEDENEIKVVISGKEYKVDKLLYETGDIESGAEGIFYLDKFGRIAGMDGSSDSKLSASEQYGWLIKASNNEDSDSWTVKLFTQGGEVKTYEVADKVTFWGPEDEAEEEILDFGKDEDVAGERLEEAAEYVKNTPAGGFQMGLVKFALNTSGKLKSLTMPYVTSNYSTADEDRVVVHNQNMSGVIGIGNILGNKFSIEDGGILFYAPSKVENINDTATYSVGTITASDYVHYEGRTIDYVVAEFDDTTPGVIIRYVGSSTEPEDFTYNTADDNSFMMVSKVQTVYDEESDEEVFKITGYANGNKMEYTTTTTTSVSAAVAMSGGVNVYIPALETSVTGYTGDLNRYYGVTPLWTAASASKIPTYTYTKDGTKYTEPLISKDNQSKYKKLTDVIGEGDIVGISTSGLKVDRIIKMFDAEDYIADSTCVWGARQAYSTTRDAIAFGRIKAIETSDTALITLDSGETYSYDPGYYVITYNVKTGEVEDDIAVSDLSEYDATTKTGDVVLLREFKGGQREIFAIRFE